MLVNHETGRELGQISKQEITEKDKDKNSYKYSFSLAVFYEYIRKEAW